MGHGERQITKIEIVFANGQPLDITDGLRENLECFFDTSQFAIGITTEKLVDEDNTI